MRIAVHIREEEGRPGIVMGNTLSFYRETDPRHAILAPIIAVVRVHRYTTRHSFELESHFETQALFAMRLAIFHDGRLVKGDGRAVLRLKISPALTISK